MHNFSPMFFLSNKLILEWTNSICFQQMYFEIGTYNSFVGTKWTILANSTILKTNKPSLKLFNISLRCFNVVHMHIRNCKHVTIWEKKGFYNILMLQACAAWLESNFSHIDSLRSLPAQTYRQHLFLDIFLLFIDNNIISKCRRSDIIVQQTRQRNTCGMPWKSWGMIWDNFFGRICIIWTSSDLWMKQMHPKPVRCTLRTRRAHREHWEN